MDIERLHDFIEELRDRVDIVALAQTCGLDVDTRRRGKYYYGRQGGNANTLMLDPKLNAYTWWNREGAGKKFKGDFLNLLETYGGMDFWQALETAANQAGMSIPRDVVKVGGDAAAMASFKVRRELLDVVTEWAARKLATTPAAIAYAIGRGFTCDGLLDEDGNPTPGTIKLTRMGFSGGTQKDRDDLAGELSMNGYDLRNPMVVDLVGMRGNVAAWCKEHGIEAQPNWLDKDRIWGVVEFPMLLYPHIRRGKVEYLSGRQLVWDESQLKSSPDKHHKSLNLHTAFWGEKRLFYNQVWDDDASVVFIVEGPADAYTLGQWGLAALALCGVSGGEELKHVIKRARERKATLYVALDADSAGQRARETVLQLAGPLSYVITWPEKDANDWLQAMIKGGKDAQAQNAEINSMLRGTPTYVETLFFKAWKAEGPEKFAANMAAARLFAKVDPAQAPTCKAQIIDRFGISKADFDVIAKSFDKKKAKKDGQGDDDEDESPEEKIIFLGGYLHEHLVDLVYDEPKQALRYAVRYPNGKVEVVPHLDLQGKRYWPGFSDAAITKGALLLPDRFGPELDEVELVKKIDRFIYDYFDFGSDKFFPRMSDYYIMLSWMADVFTKGTMIPYLRAMGDFGTGKTRLIWTVGVLCRRPLLVNGGSKPAAIRRIVDKWHPTLVVDEADFKGSDEASDMMKIYNGGNQVGNPIIITGKDSSGGFQVEIYDVYGPKLIAARKDAFDKAFGSRCLTYEPAGGDLREDIPLGFPPEFWTRATEIRGNLLAYRMRHWKPEIAVDYSKVDRSIPNRLNQVITPLRSIVNEQSLYEDLNNFVKAYAERTQSERYLTFTARILEGILRAWAWGTIPEGTEADASRVYLKDIAACVNAIIDEMNKKMGDDWDMPDGQDGDKKDGKKDGGKVTSRKVSDNMVKYLNLHTLRSTSGPASYKGTMYLEWDETRMRALCERWGIEYLQRGSLLRPKVINLNAGGEPWKQAREAWRTAGSHEKTPADEATPEDIAWLNEKMV
jgi:hypothetical protein